MTIHRVTIANGETFKAPRGQTLLAAARMSGIELPHDCCAGVCGTCRVRIVEGRAHGGDTGDPAAVLACQARPQGDLTIEVEDVPPLEASSGRVVAVNDLGWGVVEVVVEPRRWIHYLPGQYMRFEWKGFPARSYSPTAPLSGASTPGVLRLHVRRVRNGLVSNAFGRDIVAGHRVRLLGPYGSAYLRSHHAGRLVLVGTGTGFAPIWSVAHQALCERPDREMVVVAGARSPAGLYMIPALERLQRFPRVHVRPFVSLPEGHIGRELVARVAEALPLLRTDDLVYAAGSADTVRDTMAICRAAGVPCHADAFSSMALLDERAERRAVRRTRPADRDRTPPDHAAAEIVLRARQEPLCVLVCGADCEDVADLCDTIASRVIESVRTVILGIDVPIPRRGPGPARTTAPWHYLPAPPGTEPSAGPDPWSRHAADAIARLRTEQGVILIAVPPLAASTLAWRVARVCDIAILAAADGQTSALALRGLSAQGLSRIIEMSSRPPLAAAA
ncbi:2Fe-2S iron-sulfur cluster-binding protein [Alsobacter sp. R-9]